MRFSSHDVSQPSKLAFSHDVKYRLWNSSCMSAFRILSLIATPFISGRTFMSAAWMRFSNIFVVTQDSRPYRNIGLSLVYHQFALRGTFRYISNLYSMPTCWLYLAIRILISFSIVPFVLKLHPMYLKLSTCLISTSCNVILTCDGVRLMTITSVFMRLSLSWYFVKAVFQVGIHFSSDFS